MDYSVAIKKPKYLRIDGKPQPRIYRDSTRISMDIGFCELREGAEVGIVATGYMTHKALRVAEALSQHRIRAGVVDVFMLKPLNEARLYESLKKYPCLVTLEESFIKKGGLDTLIADLISEQASESRLIRFGFKDHYVFDVGSREHLHAVNGLDEGAIVTTILNRLVDPRRAQ